MTYEEANEIINRYCEQHSFGIEKGVYSVGIGKEGGELVICVSGSPEGLLSVPKTFEDRRVVTRLGGPGRLLNSSVTLRTRATRVNGPYIKG